MHACLTLPTALGCSFRFRVRCSGALGVLVRHTVNKRTKRIITGVWAQVSV